MSNEILGYTKEGEPIYPIKPGMIATAAIISCIKCRVCIRSAGGPMHGATCVKCTPDEYKEQSAAVRDVLAERNRQITAEGWATHSPRTAAAEQMLRMFTEGKARRIVKWNA